MKTCSFICFADKIHKHECKWVDIGFMSTGSEVVYCCDYNVSYILIQTQVNAMVKYSGGVSIIYTLSVRI